MSDAMNIKCEHATVSNKFFSCKCSLEGLPDNPSFGYCVNKCGKCSNTKNDLNKHMLSMRSAEANAKRQEKKDAKDKILKKLSVSQVEALKNAGKFLIQFAKHAIKTGEILASKTLRLERSRICESNTCGKYDSNKKKCLACGCGLAGLILNKTKYAAAECPQKAW